MSHCLNAAEIASVLYCTGAKHLVPELFIRARSKEREPMRSHTHRLTFTRKIQTVCVWFFFRRTSWCGSTSTSRWDQGGHLHSQALHPTSEVCHDTFRTGWWGILSVFFVHFAWCLTCILIVFTLSYSVFVIIVEPRRILSPSFRWCTTSPPPLSGKWRTTFSYHPYSTYDEFICKNR